MLDFGTSGMAGLRLGIWLLGSCCLGTAFAAEVRGTVDIEYQGLFQADASMRVHPVAVALLPAEGQRMVKRRPQTHRIEIFDNRMQPAFLTVQSGSEIEFVNRDAVYHQLFSMSSGATFSAQLAKVGTPGDDKVRVTLAETGTTHLFCRIHNKSYARIDVVDTPYLKMVEPGQLFHFVGLAPGQWKLRLAAPAAETRWVPVTAVTSPPPLQLTLTSHGGGQGAAILESSSGVEELFEE